MKELKVALIEIHLEIFNKPEINLKIKLKCQRILLEKIGTLTEYFVICMVDMTVVSGQWYEDNDATCEDDKEPAPLRSPVNNEDMINMIKAAYKHGACFLTAEELKELSKTPKPLANFLTMRVL